MIPPFFSCQIHPMPLNQGVKVVKSSHMKQARNNLESQIKSSNQSNKVSVATDTNYNNQVDGIEMGVGISPMKIEEEKESMIDHQ